MKIFYQSFYILLSCFLVLMVNLTSLSNYIKPILAILITLSVIYIILAQKKGYNFLKKYSGIQIFSVTSTLLLIIFLTGGLSSNLFFLLYLLIFSVVFLLEPATVFVLAAGLTVVFYPLLSETDFFLHL